MGAVTPPVHVLVADPSPLYRLGIRIALEQANIPYKMIEAASWQKTHEHLRQQATLDLLVLNSVLDGLDSLGQLCTLIPGSDCALIIMTASDQPAFTTRAIGCGAQGVIHKTTPLTAIGQAMCTVLDGGCWYPSGQPESFQGPRDMSSFNEALYSLTRSEKKVLPMIKQGLLNKQIAEQLHLSEHTIKLHLSHIYRKLNIKNRTHLAIVMNDLTKSRQGGRPELSI